MGSRNGSRSRSHFSTFLVDWKVSTDHGPSICSRNDCPAGGTIFTRFRQRWGVHQQNDAVRADGPLHTITVWNWINCGMAVFSRGKEFAFWTSLKERAKQISAAAGFRCRERRVRRSPKTMQTSAASLPAPVLWLSAVEQERRIWGYHQVILAVGQRQRHLP